MLSPPRDHPETSVAVAVAAAAMAKEPEMVAVAAEAGGERKRKKTLGRQKIEIKRINCPSAKHVCFSKRRSGLYKKAAELCVLTEASLAVVVFSPADKPYSLGYPSVPAVLEGYLDPASYVPPTAAEAAALEATAREFDRERERMEEAIKAEKQRQIALDAAARAAGAWAGDGDALLKGPMPELVAMLAALERVRDEAKMMQRAHEVIAEEAIMMQQCAAAAGAGDAATGAFQFQYEYPVAGAFTADGVGGAAGGSSYYQEVLDTQMMLMGGNVVRHGGVHAPLPFAPMLLLPDLPPQPHFNYGSDHYYNVAGYAGYCYGYDLVDGSNHEAAYEIKEGYYGTKTTTTCNFFG